MLSWSTLVGPGSKVEVPGKLGSYYVVSTYLNSIRSSYEVAVHLYRYSTNFPKGGAWSEASLRPLLKISILSKNELYPPSYDAM